MYLNTRVLLSILTSGRAYLDPGSGSILLQLLIAGLATAGIVIASQWRRIGRIFGRKKAQVDDDEDENDEQEPTA